MWTEVGGRISSDIRQSHDDEFEGCSLPGCDALYSGRK
jgi:hypothetical protein